MNDFKPCPRCGYADCDGLKIDWDHPDTIPPNVAYSQNQTFACRVRELVADAERLTRAMKHCVDVMEVSGVAACVRCASQIREHVIPLSECKDCERLRKELAEQTKLAEDSEDEAATMAGTIIELRKVECPDCDNCPDPEPCRQAAENMDESNYLLDSDLQSTFRNT
jgi:hypothetical protein